MVNEMNEYLDAIDLIENRVANNNQFPVIKKNKINQFCMIFFEFIKLVIYYIKYSINRNATKTESKTKK